MGSVVFMVEPESRSGSRWHIKRSGSIRATYSSRAQAVMDARQLAFFEYELHGQSAIVRVLDAQRQVAEDFVCDDPKHFVAPAPDDDAAARPGGAKLILR